MISMGWLKKLLGMEAKNLKEEWKQGLEESEQILEKCMNSIVGVDATIQMPKFGYLKCPKCRTDHPVAVDVVRSKMQQTNKDAVFIVICHKCGAKIRIRP